MKVSESTLAWERWRQRRRRKRTLLSWTGSILLVAMLVGLAVWGGFALVIDVGEKGEALLVKLGNPEGEDLPLSVSAVPDQAMQAVMSAQRTSALTTVEETRATVEPEILPQPAPVTAPAKAPARVPAPAPPPSATPVPATKQETPEPVPATPAPQPAVPDRAPVPTPTPTPTAVPAPVPVPVPERPVVTEKVIRGSEKGNASELILKPQGDKISQNAYWPVYLFMPLPEQIEASLLGRIRATDLYSIEERRSLVLQVYTQAGNGLILSADPGLAVRPALWEILEGAGYDVANADYKKGKALKPVVITFQLGIPKGSGDTPALVDVKLEQSSGNGPVDEAVLYAFQRSSFANGTGKVAQGRYTYDFSTKK